MLNLILLMHIIAKEVKCMTPWHRSSISWGKRIKNFNHPEKYENFHIPYRCEQIMVA